MNSIHIPCSVSYWSAPFPPPSSALPSLSRRLAHSLAAQEGALDSEERIQRLISLLQNSIDCLSASVSSAASPEMKRHAKEQIRELTSYLKERREIRSAAR
jgi:hypothetical protein